MVALDGLLQIVEEPELNQLIVDAVRKYTSPPNMVRLKKIEI